MSKLFRKGAYMLFVCLLVLLVATGAFAQGKGRGGGGGHGGGVGNAGGPPPGAGVDRSMGNSSNRSRGRSDERMGNDSMRSNGRSEREDRASTNLRHADDDLREHPNLPRALHMNANDLRAGFQAALAKNPNLTFGNFVAATRLGQNLHSRFPNITRDAILNGLASGKSLGQTLQALGLGERESKEARKQAEREMKEARKD